MSLIRAATAAAAVDDVLVVLASGPSGAPLRLRWLPSSSITIADLLSKLPVGVTHVRYADPEGDVCTVRSDAELAAAIECAAIPNGRGVGGRPRRMLRVSYDVAAVAAAPSAPACAPPSSPAPLGAALVPALAAAAAPKARPAAAAPKGLAKGRTAAKDGDKLTRLRERSNVLKDKLTSSTDDARSARLSDRLAAVNAKIVALSNAPPAVAASTPAIETLGCTAVAETPAPVSPLEATTPVAAPPVAARPKQHSVGHRVGLKAENVQAHLTRHAARGAAVEQKTVELQSAAEAARQAGDLKRAAVLDAAVARCRQQSAKIAERRVALLNHSTDSSAPAHEPTGPAKEPAAAASAAAPTEYVATAAVSPIVVLPVEPLCGLGPMSMEQRQIWLSAQHTSVLAEISMLSNTIATVRANGHPRRAEALTKRLVNLQERAARLEQRRAFLATKHAKHADRAGRNKHADRNNKHADIMPVIAKPNGPAAVLPLTPLTAARPIARGRGKPQFVAQHQLAKLKERRALIDARIAQLEAEVECAH